MSNKREPFRRGKKAEKCGKREVYPVKTTFFDGVSVTGKRAAAAEKGEHFEQIVGKLSGVITLCIISRNGRHKL